MTTRPDGRSYIDVPPSTQEDVPDKSEVPPNASSSESSGSSIEESDGEEPVWSEEESDSQTPAQQHGEAGLHAEDDDEDWDVDDEDWELADGDFTKHYNRLRQHHAAVSAGPNSKPPLPTRNVNFTTSNTPGKKSHPSVLAGGVATNPKAVSHEKDKADRATEEGVLDSRTRLVLAGLVNRGIIGKLERCISTGKEANVYYADNGEAAVAVKVYRTSILAFKSRQAYIVGEHRFKGEYSSSKNPRKMIRVWAEKELRNLRRLEQGGVRTPKVFDCKENVLVMEFLGNDVAAPRLRDAALDEHQWSEAYVEMLVAMRRMFQTCRLVHADLSEYNVLWHDSHVYVIDVSQSVESDHPRSYDFLRTDIRNVKDFFARQGIANMLSLRRMWDFVVDPALPDHEEELLALVRNREESDDLDDDAVFMSSFIPRSLAEVYDPERDVEVVKAGKGDQLIYAGLAGLKDKVGVTDEPRMPLTDDNAAVDGAQSKFESVRIEDSEVTPDDVQETDEEEAEDEDRPRGFRHEDRDAKKERKKAVKEEQRERRKQKMSKSEKQRLIKKSSHK